MKDILLLDESLQVRIYYECDDCDWADNICVSFREDCPEDERLFRANETNIFLTPHEAKQLALELINAANQSLGFEDKESLP